MLRNKDTINLLDTISNTQYKIESIKDLTSVLVASLKNQMTNNVILRTQDNLSYPVGEGLTELAIIIEKQIKEVYTNLNEVYNQYTDRKDK